MGNLIIPKHTAENGYFVASLLVLEDQDDWIGLSEFTDLLFNKLVKMGIETVRADDNTHYTKCLQLPCYYGFAESDELKAQSKKRITQKGLDFISFYREKNFEGIWRLFFDSFQNMTFGRNNPGCPTSDSDYEAPNIFMKASLLLNGLSRKEYAFILWELDKNQRNFEEVIIDIIICRRQQKEIALKGEANKYKDPKIILSLENWGLLLVDDGKTIINPQVLEKYGIIIRNLRIKNTGKTCLIEKEINNTTTCSFPHNRILFGAPGTGKSHQLDSNLKDENGVDYFAYHERVTFHPSYSYANFVGTYKPVKDEKGNGQITYEFVEGPFIRILRQALNNPEKNYLLIIEEINRANVTAVFGDVFQLLDRDSNNISQYEVAASEDLRKHLLKNEVQEDKSKKLKIPANMYIWATMNSADQGVQPLDTAFKRRWEFEYLNINNSETKIDENMKDIKFPDQTMDWNLLRHLINNRLSANYNINEDKLLGPFFIKKGNLTNDQFINAFKSKVLMYLFEDVCKINPKPLFAGIKDEGKIHFSKVVENFDAYGIGIFGFSGSEIEAARNEIKNY